MKYKVIKLLALAMVFLLIRPYALMAEHVSVDDARSVALRYLRGTATKSASDAVVKLSFSSLSLFPETKASNNTAFPTFYCFTTENDGGFVIVSADNAVKPILAYSDSGIMPDEANMPPAFKHWLQYIDVQINEIRQKPAEISDAHKTMWSSTSVGTTLVQYETARWHQLEPFNP